MYIDNPGHMTKPATMPMYGRNPSKISGTVDRFQQNLACSIDDSSASLCILMTLIFFKARSN